MASSRDAPQQAAMQAEAQQVLEWAWRHFPQGHGPVEEGGLWDHELLVHDEPGGWRTVMLTLSAAPEFVDAFLAAVGTAGGD